VYFKSFDHLNFSSKGLCSTFGCSPFHSFTTTHNPSLLFLSLSLVCVSVRGLSIGSFICGFSVSSLYISFTSILRSRLVFQISTLGGKKGSRFFPLTILSVSTSPLDSTAQSLLSRLLSSFVSIPRLRKGIDDGADILPSSILSVSPLVLVRHNGC
jgi:hypothetical protein